ncbi:MAG: hypothetical protein WD872_18185 [Pirellulaceae bacterium]
MKPNRLLVLVILILPACQRAVPTQGPSPEGRLPPPGVAPPPAGHAPAADKIFQALTGHTWSTREPGNQRQRFLVDYHVTKFQADGTWSTQHITDYQIPARTGKWNLQRSVSADGQESGKEWCLCRDNGLRQRIRLNTDGSLALSSTKLYPDQPRWPDPKWSAKTLPALALPPEVERINERLTAHDWKRANDLDLRSEPMQIRFSPDWTYFATYRGGTCTSRGTWYATAEQIGAANPAGRCDDRPGTGGDQLTAEVIDDRRILVNGDLYVPEEEPVKRGIIWTLFGFRERTVRIEYDMPIRRNVPIRLDVTVTNVADQNLTLDRFSLTRGYSSYGRDGGTTGQALVLPEDEITGVDLERVELAPGKSHSFALSASFSQAGVQTLYFNALISGTTQNWDTHEARQVTVRE